MTSGSERVFSNVSILALSMMLSACGDDGNGTGGIGGAGGTGGSGGALTGFLVDSPVSGVAYETLTQSGLTDAEGAFQYLAGETVRFTLGDILLGEVSGQAEVTPFDLAGAEVVTGRRNLREGLGFADPALRVVANLALLLQSFDDDDDPSNGINIPEGVAALFSGVDLDLTQPLFGFPLSRLLLQSLVL